MIAVVADCHNGRLALWRLRDGSVWKHFGSYGLEPGQFRGLQAVAATKQNALVVTDAHLVKVLTLHGAVLCVLDPSRLPGAGHLSSFLPGIAVCPNTDDIFVTNNEQIVALTCTVDPENVRIPFDFDVVSPG